MEASAKKLALLSPSCRGQKPETRRSWLLGLARQRVKTDKARNVEDPVTSADSSTRAAFHPRSSRLQRRFAASAFAHCRNHHLATPSCVSGRTRKATGYLPGQATAVGTAVGAGCGRRAASRAWARADDTPRKPVHGRARLRTGTGTTPSTDKNRPHACARVLSSCTPFSR